MFSVRRTYARLSEKSHENRKKRGIGKPENVLCVFKLSFFLCLTDPHLVCHFVYELSNLSYVDSHLYYVL